MHNRLRIKEVGVRDALCALLPKVREAGQLALRLQPLISTVQGPEQKQAQQPELALLTHADLLVQDMIGIEVFQLVEDASFYGEEREHDHISRFIPTDRPYLITLDPINGTLQYRDGLPHFEIILTVCDRAWNMLGALIYRPAFNEVYMGWKDTDGKQHARCTTPLSDDMFYPEGSTYDGVLRLPGLQVTNAVHLDASWKHHETTLCKKGYAFVDIWSDYKGQSDWPYSQTDPFTGKCRGTVWRDEWAFHIDAAAICFIVECAGGVVRRGTLDKEKLTYSYLIAATDSATADLLEQLVAL